MEIIISKEFPLLRKIQITFRMDIEILESDTLHLFLLPDGIRTDDNKYLECLETATECTKEQI